MNQKNFEFLSQQLHQIGFGVALIPALQEKIMQGDPGFHLLQDGAFGPDRVQVMLHFRQSPESGLYFFNRYDLTLQTENGNGSISQSFYIYARQDNILYREGYNLLCGRAVYKCLQSRDGNSYQAWLQLDFSERDKYGNYRIAHFHENYGFRLEKALEVYPILELRDDSLKCRLLESLERGNRQMVTLQHQGREEKYFIEACPRFKNLNFLDAAQKRIHPPVPDSPAAAEKTATGENPEDIPEPAARKRKRISPHS